MASGSAVTNAHKLTQRHKRYRRCLRRALILKMRIKLLEVLGMMMIKIIMLMMKILTCDKSIIYMILIRLNIDDTLIHCE